MHEIIPGILEKEWGEIERKIKLVLPFAKTIHIDLLDGKFADNTTFFDPAPFAKYAKQVTLELHMMVEDPIQYLEIWAASGFVRFLGHVEKMPDQHAFVTKAKTFGEAGLALDGQTDPSAIKVPFIDLDSLLVYTSEKVGFSGPPFLPDRLQKVEAIKKEAFIPVEIDGGINDQTIVSARNAGATRFVTTSFLFQQDPAVQYKKLQELVC